MSTQKIGDFCIVRSVFTGHRIVITPDSITVLISVCQAVSLMTFNCGHRSLSHNISYCPCLVSHSVSQECNCMFVKHSCTQRFIETVSSTTTH
jgi:hypothetical protein